MLVETLAHGRLVFDRLQKLWLKTGRPYLVIDTETEPISGFGKKAALTIGRAKIIIWSLTYQGESYSFPTAYFNPKYPSALQWGALLRPFVERTDVIKVFHNANYDVNVLSLNAGLTQWSRIWCTMIGAWKANASRLKALKERAPFYGRLLNRTSVISFTDLNDLANYAEQDAIATDELYQMQWYGFLARPKIISSLSDKGLITLQKNPLPAGLHKIDGEALTDFDKLFICYQELPVLRATIRAEQRGLPFAVSRLQKIRSKFLKDRQALLERIYRMAGSRLNLNSGIQLAELFDKLELKSLGLTKKTKRPRTDAYALNWMRENHPIISSILDYKQLEKLRQAYIGSENTGEKSGLEYYVSPDGCIHSTLNTVGAVTGRFSSDHPNAQQIPARKDVYKIRECFVAQSSPLLNSSYEVNFQKQAHSNKRLLIDIDYSQMELRVACLYCKDPMMERILSDSTGDIHQVTADRFKINRNPEAKNINFLMLYAGGPGVLAKTLTFAGAPTTKAQAETYLIKANELYPQIREWRKSILLEHKKNGFVYYLDGRTRSLPEINWSEEYSVHKAETILSNNLVQGQSQDFIKAAIVRIDPLCANIDAALPSRMTMKSAHALLLKSYACKLEKYRKEFRLAKLEFLLQVHDEILLSVEASAAEEIMNLVCEVMCWRHYFPLRTNYNVPLVAEGGVGENWHQAKNEPLSSCRKGFENWKF
jgi:DNA polymerase I-like protein with 3'-5' exonuclease and polymerase domains